MNFYKVSSLLSLFTVSLLSTTANVAEVIQDASSCYDFTMNINTDETPEGISWKIENMNTSEIVASQDEGFYTEAQNFYTHDESICLDLDNTDICYNITVSDTSEDDDYPSTRTFLFYDNEDPEDRYYKSTDVNEMNIVCGFDDFESWYGCLYSEGPPEPSCACDKLFSCYLEDAFAIIFAIVFCPCLSIQFVIFVLLVICYY